MKKFASLLMVCAMVVGVLAAVPSGKAEAANETYTGFEQAGYSGNTFSTSEDNYNVYASVYYATPPGGILYAYTRLILQRYVNGAWTNIEVKYGYADSDNPQHAGFTNISTSYDAPTRVILKRYNDSSYSTASYIGAVYSPSWIR